MKDLTVRFGNRITIDNTKKGIEEFQPKEVPLQQIIWSDISSIKVGLGWFNHLTGLFRFGNTQGSEGKILECIPYFEITSNGKVSYIILFDVDWSKVEFTKSYLVKEISKWLYTTSAFYGWPDKPTIKHVLSIVREKSGYTIRFHHMFNGMHLKSGDLKKFELRDDLEDNSMYGSLPYVYLDYFSNTEFILPIINDYASDERDYCFDVTIDDSIKGEHTITSMIVRGSDKPNKTKLKDVSLRDLTLQQLNSVGRVISDLDYKIRLDSSSKKLLQTRFGINVTDFHSKELVMFMSMIGYTPICSVSDGKEPGEESGYVVGWESTIRL